MKRVIVVAAGLVLAACSSSTSGRGTGSSSPSSPAGSSPSTRTATRTVPPSSTHPSSSTGVAGRAAPRLSDFRATSLTWIGDQGWALGGAKCLSGKGTCDAIEHTTDGGTSWASWPAPVAGIAGHCTSTCVDGIRFASTRTGYAYGRDSLFMTRDGGRHWTRQTGNAYALEALDGTVLRVSTSTPGCPPECDFQVFRAAVGSTRWTRIQTGSAHLYADAVTLGRADRRAYLEVFQNPAGGAQHATASLFTSTDDGAHWTARGEPCPQIGGENDSRLLSVAPTGSAAIVCVIRGAAERATVITSATGASWHRPSGDGLGSSGSYALGAVTRARSVLSGGDATYLTTDAGARFTRVGAPAQLQWLGFGSTSVGHAISKDGRSVWSTHDGGATWRRHTFS